jgi:subtilisin family serine protease
MSNDENTPQPIDKDGRISVLIELRASPGGSGALSMSQASRIELPGFQLDQQFNPVSLGGQVGADGFASSLPSYVVRGTVANEEQLEKLRQNPEVAEVWRDTPIAPFAKAKDAGLGAGPVAPDDNLGSGACPIGTCDCQPGTPKGNMADVATYLGVDQIWARGIRGSGIVVGVLDSGITAQGRPVKAGETARRIPRVIGGWPLDDWGTESSKWGDHGNMCATDVLGMAPEAQLYDLRIAGAGGSPGTISRALQAFQWAIDQHRRDGTPHILTNSWGIFQETWDTTYARNPNHPFTRKVVEAIDEGIIVLFAAGNCGSTCPDGRCGPDNGPGRSIWGANSHPRVMTVGAVNRLGQFIGYSSQGPGALDPNKPDFCGISHFTGYFNSDSGTSAATPIIAGVCALLKQANSSLTQDQIKDCLKATAQDIGPPGFDQHSGAGIVRAKAAYDRCGRRITTTPLRDIAKVPILDTVAARDRIFTDVRRDRFETTPLRDELKPVISDTTPVRDQLGTNPRIDFAKSPRLDTLQEGIPTPEIPRDPFPRPGLQQPFVLAQPHHAEDWAWFDDGAAGAGQANGLAMLEQEIGRISADLEALMAQYQALRAEMDGGCCGEGEGGGY